MTNARSSAAPRESLRNYQARLRAVCFDVEPRGSDMAMLGGDAWRWARYRRLVRVRLMQTIEHAFGRTMALVGRARFERWVTRFLAERGPSSPYLRDVPGELLAFLEEQLAGADGVWPASALDLARYEWAELSAAYLPDEVTASVDLQMDLPAILTPAHRILRLAHAVHRIPALDEDADDETAARLVTGAVLPPGPVTLCLYRDPTTHEVRTLELTAVTACLLEAIAAPDRPALTDAVKRAAVATGAIIDEKFVLALSETLADFVERGIVLGSRASLDF